MICTPAVATHVIKIILSSYLAKCFVVSRAAPVGPTAFVLLVSVLAGGKLNIDSDCKTDRHRQTQISGQRDTQTEPMADAAN